MPSYNADHQRAYRQKQKRTRVQLEERVHRLVAEVEHLHQLLQDRQHGPPGRESVMYKENLVLFSMLPAEKQLDWMAAKRLRALCGSK